jgi:hypothetical protein
LNRTLAFLKLTDKMKKVAFDDVAHSYTYKGRTLTSVTSIIKRHFPPFDKDGKIRTRIAEKEGINKKEVQDMWTAKAKLGTVVHAGAEQLLWAQRMQEDPVVTLDWIKEYNPSYSNTYPLYLGQVSNFMEENKYDFIMSELIVYSPLYSVCGTIDFILYDPVEESLVLGDWKTSTNIMGEGVSFEEYGYGKLSHLPSTNFYQYALQLSVYRRLLEDWGWKVSEQFVVHLKENSYKVITLPYLSDEAGIILRSNLE